jgi:hypothetical protein
MVQFLKGNSCLLAFDSSPAYTTGEKLGLFFVDLIQDFEFSISPARTQSRQIGSQCYGADSINFSPDVIANLSFITSNNLSNESLLGTVFRPSGNFSSPFSGINDWAFNSYLFFSQEQGEDLIHQISRSNSFSGVGVIALGNCFLSNGNFSFSANSLPRTSCSLLASNIVSETLSGNYMQIPAVNLENGEVTGAAQIFLDPAQVSRIETGSLSGIMPIWSAEFQPTFESLQIPSQSLAAGVSINNMEISFSIDRENSYGFGSDYVYSRDVKFPIQTSVSINGVVNDYQSGSFSDLMINERRYNIQIYNRDPQDSFLSGLSVAETTGLANIDHLVKNRWLQLNNCILRESANKVSVNELFEYSVSFDMGVTEGGEMLFKQGEPHSFDDVNINSADFHLAVSRDGFTPIHDPFLQYYEGDCSVANLLSSDREILMTRDNFIESWLNPTCSVTPIIPTPPTWVFTDYHGQGATSFYWTWPLEWELTEPFDSFNIYRNGVLIANTTEKTYIDTPSEFEFFTYTVSSLLNGQESEIPESQYLDVQYVDILEAIPFSPGIMEGSTTYNGVANITISYLPNPSYEFGDVEYVSLYRNWSSPSDSEEEFELITTFENGNTQYEDAGLTDIGKTYSYKIKISISPRESNFSEPTSITRV